MIPREKSKTPNDPSGGTVKTAVDRASSRTPLDEDEKVDPARTRDNVLRKREAENRGGQSPANPNVGPGSVRAQPDQDD